jgi:membrane associated rhomboid family serine protease
MDALVGYRCRECVQKMADRIRQGKHPYESRPRDNPILTVSVIILINLTVCVLLRASGGEESPWVDRLGLIPRGRCDVSSDPSMYYSDLDRAACLAQSDAVWRPGVASGAVWQLLTSVFSHVGWLHLGLNMAILWFCGPTLEVALGRTRWLALFLLSSLGGSVGILWLGRTDQTMMGASGAGFGLLAGLIVFMRPYHELRHTLFLIGLCLVDLLWQRDNVSWQGHLGGLLVGLVISLILARRPPEAGQVRSDGPAPACQRSRRQWLALSGVALVLAGLTLARCLMLA